MKNLYSFSLLTRVRQVYHIQHILTGRFDPTRLPDQVGPRSQGRKQQRKWVVNEAIGPGHHQIPHQGAAMSLSYQLPYKINKLSPQQSWQSGEHVKIISIRTHLCLFLGSNATCRILKLWMVQNICQGWLASWLIYLKGKPWTRFRTRNCMCAFLCNVDGDSNPVGMCLSKVSSVSV
jgi:hypothetical protein